MGERAGRIAEEIIAHVAGRGGGRVAVTLEIITVIPSGAPDDAVRIVTEDGKTLKFGNNGYLRE